MIEVETLFHAATSSWIYLANHPDTRRAAVIDPALAFESTNREARLVNTRVRFPASARAHPGGRSQLALARFALASAFFLACTAADAADPDLGSHLASQCSSCHGESRGTRVIAPLAGQPREVLEAALRDFRSKQRPGGLMQTVAATLKDEDIAAVADYYARRPAPPVGARSGK